MIVTRRRNGRNVSSSRLHITSSYYVSSLPDAEPGKDRPQDLVGGDLPRDLAEVMEGCVDVDGDQVGGKAGIESLLDRPDGRKGVLQGIKMAGIGYDGPVVKVVDAHGVQKAFRDHVEVLLPLGRDEDGLMIHKLAESPGQFGEKVSLVPDQDDLLA